MCASIVTGVDAPPVLEPAERIFDLVPFAIENAVMFDRLCAVGLRWDAGRDTPDRERLAEPVGVVALVAEQLLRGRTKGGLLITRWSSTLATPCDKGKYGSIRRICA